MCRVCGCCSVCIVVMDVIWRRLCAKYDLQKGDLFVLSWARLCQLRQ